MTYLAREGDFALSVQSVGDLSDAISTIDSTPYFVEGEVNHDARHWRGWTEVGNADAYETLL